MLYLIIALVVAFAANIAELVRYELRYAGRRAPAGRRDTVATNALAQAQDTALLEDDAPLADDELESFIADLRHLDSHRGWPATSDAQASDAQSARDPSRPAPAAKNRG